MKYLLFTILCTTLNFVAFAQLLSPPSAKDFSHHQRFNPSFIAANNIQEIRCSVESKRDGDKIKSTHKSYVYQFHKDGNVRLISEIDYKLGDTAVTVFTYAGNRLECEVKNDAAGMFSYCYNYGDDGLPISRKYGRTARSSSLMANEVPTRVTEVATENYTHARFENQLHTTLHNSAGRPYIKEIRYYDENEYLLRYSQAYIMSSDRYEETYAYNMQGWISELQIPHPAAQRYTYSYDQVGNLLEEVLYKQASEIYRKEYVYEGNNMLIRAELRRDEAVQIIYITNYTYGYW